MLRSPGLHWAMVMAVLLSLGGPRVGPGADWSGGEAAWSLQSLLFHNRDIDIDVK